MATKLSRRTAADRAERDALFTEPSTAEHANVVDGAGLKLLIGVNADHHSARKDIPAFSHLHTGYCESIRMAGGIPVILPPVMDEEDLRRVLDGLDGIVLSGGADLDPRLDGFMLHPSIRLLDRRREEFDRMLVGLVAARRMAVLGIGSGMQLLNVSQGGSLFLHLPEELPHALPHRDTSDPNHSHTLVVEAGSLMGQVYGESEIRVSSMHHMAVDDVAPGFAVTARCPDGVIEAIESTMADWFAIGVQFHPEEDRGTKLDIGVFEQFMLGISRTRKLQMVA
jgi:putative glutamine amidotransferase